ncbi:MAG: molybdenum cofactor biosynthesis protein B [Rhizobiales bacterium]|nr:molybdenum cofactor biosynthesis protein B [Hyphomicrobiales bacterium]MBI3674328.1 molybdenum cofactor biosynthesis protein B [Hyphomicrobiales bacterium]
MTAGNRPRDFIPVRIAVLTISDTRGLEDDTSGQVLSDRIGEAGHRLSARKVVKDDIRAIRHVIRDWTNRDDIDVIISTGGTGLTGNDVTVEAMRPLFDKEIDGFGPLFHTISFAKIGTSTIQSRATAGIMKGKYIFCLPGSPGACRDGWDDILKAQLDYRHKPCNFVEIMPRLTEHMRGKAG